MRRRWHQRRVRYVIGDERDRWALSAGTEGDPWELARARTTTFFNRKLIDVSTPTIKGASAIERSFLDGTQERWCHACPHCGAYHNIVFDRIKFEFETVKHKRQKDYIVKSVSYCCPSCGCLSSEEEMRRQPARWIAENPEGIEQRTSLLLAQCLFFTLDGMEEDRIFVPCREG